jgi:YD repeat-containing protein
MGGSDLRALFRLGIAVLGTLAVSTVALPELAGATPAPLLGPNGAVWFGPITPSSPPIIRQNRDFITISPVSRELAIEVTDLSIEGAGAPLEVVRRWSKSGWTWDLFNSVDEETTGVTLNRAGEEIFVGVPELTPSPIPIGTIIRNDEIVVSRMSFGWEVTIDNQRERYNTDGEALDKTDAYGNTTTFRRSGGQLVEVTISDGRSLSINWGLSGHMRSITSNDGRQVTYEFREERLTAAESPNRGRTRYIWDDQNRPTRVLWPDGSRVKIIWGSNNDNSQGISSDRVEMFIGPGSARADFSWRDGGFVSRDASGGTTEVASTSQGYTVRDPSSRIVSVTTDTGDLDGLVTGWRDPRGLDTRLNYDTTGNLVSLDLPGGGSWGFEWRNDHLISSTNPAGSRWIYRRDSAGGTIAVRDPDGRETRYDRGSNGEITSIERGGAPLRLSRDRTGRITSIARATGGETRISRNSRGEIIAFTDPTGEAIQLGRDGLGRIVTVRERDDTIWRIGRNMGGTATSFTCCQQDVWQIGRRSSGLPESITLNNQEIATWGWGPTNLPQWFKYDGYNPTYFEWSSASLLMRVERPDGSQISIERDPLGEISEMSYLDSNMEISRDLDSRPLTVGPLSFSWSNGAWESAEGPSIALLTDRSGAGAVRSFTIGNAPRVPITRDAAGRVVAIGSGSGVYSIERDASGIATGFDTPHNRGSHSTLDNRGLPTIVSVDGAGQDITQRALRDSTSQIIRWTSESGSALSVNRDAIANITTIRYPDGSLTRTEERPFNSWRMLEDQSGETIQSIEISRGYNGLTDSIKVNGVNTLHRRDPNGTLVALESDTTWSWLPGYTEESSGAFGVTLDNELRPVEATATSAAQTWGSDSGTLLYQFTGNRLASVETGVDNFHVEHDALGRPTRLIGERGGRFIIDWDHLGRVDSITTERAQTILMYNTSGLRASRSGNETIEYLHEPGLGWIANGQTPLSIPTNEIGTPFYLTGSKQDEAIGWSPLGFPTSPPPLPLRANGTWALHHGGLILDGAGAIDTVSGVRTVMPWRPNWDDGIDSTANWPVIDGSAKPWWAPDPWMPEADFSDPIELLVTMRILEPVLDGSWLVAEANVPPLGWLPESSATPAPPLAPVPGALPISLNEIETISFLATVSPTHSIDTYELLNSILSINFDHLPRQHWSENSLLGLWHPRFRPRRGL